MVCRRCPDALLSAQPLRALELVTPLADNRRQPSRGLYPSEAMIAGYSPSGTRWYADNTREPIRDETLREGLMAVGAVIAPGRPSDHLQQAALCA